MALDIHLAKSRKEAPYTDATTCFEEHIHEFIFDKTCLPENIFPLFKRMADYYKDTHYDFSEIESLVNEISRIKKLFSKDIIVQEQLTKIEMACVKAMESKLSIWVFCD